MVVVLSTLTVLTRRAQSAVKRDVTSMLSAAEAVSNPEMEMQLLWDTSAAETTLFTVCVDPGHGGNDSGSVSGSRRESEDNLAVALAIRDALERRNIKVVMTRIDDEYIYLKERVEIADLADAQYFLSIHRNLNYAGCGVETWTASEYDEET